MFAPHGKLASFRKMMSYDGAIDGRDPGNWTYAVSLKAMSHHFSCHEHPYTEIVTTLNDETNGDVIEAILGLVPFFVTPYLATISPRLADYRSVIICNLRHIGATDFELDSYIGIMAEAVMQVELISKLLANFGIWHDSTTFSYVLC